MHTTGSLLDHDSRSTAAEHTLWWTQRLHALAVRLGSAFTPNEVARVVLSEAQLAFGAPNGSMSAVDEDGDTMRMLGALGYTDTHLAGWRSYSLAQSGAPTRDVVSSGVAMFFESREECGRDYPDSFIATLVANNVQALAILPVAYDGRVRGVFGLTWSEPRAFPADERALFSTFAAQCAQALERARLYEAERAAREQVTRLQDLTAALSRALRVRDVAHVVLHRALPMFEAATGTVMLLAKDRQHFELLDTIGIPESAMAPWRRYPLTHGTPGADVVQLRGPVFLESQAAYAAAYPTILEQIRDAGVQASATLPLESEGRVMGVIALSFAAPRSFPREERGTMAAFAHQCAQALDRARLYEAEHAVRRRTEVLARAGQFLSASLDVRATLQSVADVIAESIADYCVTYLVADDGTVQRAAGAHTDSTKRHLIDHLLQLTCATSLQAAAVQVMRTGEPLFSPAITDEALERAAGTSDVAALWLALGPRSSIIVPLRARGRTMGVLAATTVQGGRPAFDADEVSLIQELASRAALAADNARLYAEAEHANRAKMDFLATMSHELRTPLNAIAGYAELLATGVRGTLTEVQHTDILRIQKSQQHLLGLINAVLNFAKLEAGHVTYEMRTLSVCELFIELGAMVEPQMELKELLYSCVPSDEGLAVRGDREKVVQILLNLLTNAIKYTPAGGSITVWAGREHDRVAMHVRDTGPGIPVDRAQHIFEPFVQIDSRLTRQVEGVGLGLAISRELARAMGGELSVSSADGNGSVFTLMLRGVG